MPPARTPTQKPEVAGRLHPIIQFISLLFLGLSLLVIASWSANAALSDQLVFYMAGENTSWTDTAYGKTLTSNATIVVGKVGNGMDFEVSSSQTINGSVSGLPTGNSSRSTCAWVKYESAVTHMMTLGWGTNSAEQSYNVYRNSAGNYSTVDNADLISSNISPSVGSWYHLCTVWSNTTGSSGTWFYVNGSLGRNVTTDDGYNTGTTKLCVGSDFCTQNYMDGIVDELKVWNRTLTAAEVSQDYNSGSGCDITCTYANATGSAPSISSLAIAPLLPLDTENLNCTATLTDNDNSTILANYTWYNGSTALLTGQTSVTNNTATLVTALTANYTAVGETWKCQIIPTDGVNVGTAQNATVTIQSSESLGYNGSCSATNALQCYETPTISTYLDGVNYLRKGFQFIANQSYTLKNISLNISKTGSGSSFQIELWSGNTIIPTTKLADFGSYTMTGLNNNTWTNYTNTTGYYLTNNSRYWVVIYIPTGDGLNFINLAINNSLTNAHAFAQSVDGTTWTNSSTAVATHRLYGNTTPYINYAPSYTLVAPTNGASNQSLSVMLTLNVTDANGDTLNVSFYAVGGWNITLNDTCSPGGGTCTTSLGYRWSDSILPSGIAYNNYTDTLWFVNWTGTVSNSSGSKLTELYKNNLTPTGTSFNIASPGQSCAHDTTDNTWWCYSSQSAVNDDSGKIYHYDSAGTYLKSFSAAGRFEEGLAVTRNGTLYSCGFNDAGTGHLSRWDKNSATAVENYSWFKCDAFGYRYNSATNETFFTFNKGATSAENWVAEYYLNTRTFTGVNFTQLANVNIEELSFETPNILYVALDSHGVGPYSGFQKYTNGGGVAGYLGSDAATNNTLAEYLWSGLNYNTTYNWYAILDDSTTTNTTTTYSFTTGVETCLTPPQVTDLSANLVTNTSATITYTKPAGTTGTVLYRNGTILFNGTNSSVNYRDSGLNFLTPYNYWTYTYNTTLTCGDIYNTTRTSGNDINITTLANNSFYITFYDELTGALLTGYNISLSLVTTNTSTNYSTTTAFITSSNITPNDYILRYRSPSHRQRDYQYTFTETSNLNLSLYLLETSNSDVVTFSYVDSITDTPVIGSNVTATTFVNGVLTLVETHTGDVSGRTAFVYSPTQRYIYTVTTDGYEYKTFTLDPVAFTTYTVPLKTNITITNIENILVNINNYFKIGTNNLTITFYSPTNALTSYDFTFNYPGGTYTDSGTTSSGETFTTTTTINLTGYVNVTYHYTTANDEQTIYRTYPINNETTTYTIFRNKDTADTTYGLGWFERVLISTILTIFAAGFIGLIAGATAGLVMALFIMSIFMAIGFLPIIAYGLVVLISIVFLFRRTI